ncbi:MAG TPA: hypothetical protein VHE35_22260 [Kofleriaceae bacterium]|nr:hypothetical protein [Kofleriaceae bacterium]
MNDRPPPIVGRPVAGPAAVVGVAGAIAIGLGFAVVPERAFAAYLAAWSAVATLAIGGLAMLMIGYAANARWPSVVRRPTEAVAAALAPVAVLAIPLFVAPARVWPWVDPSPELVHAVEVKRAWLSVPFFTVRSAVYLGLFVVAAELLRAWSRRRDRTPAPGSPPPDADVLRRERRFASVALPVLGLAVTFAAFDWLMSLQPDWWSSGFGLYILAGALASGQAAIVVAAWRAHARGALPLRPPHYHALGRVLHALVTVWAYLAYFQAMLIQIADKPSEVGFYLQRTGGGWQWAAVAMVALLFAIPFPLLIFRAVKRRGNALAAIAALVVAGHLVHSWWLVVPRVSDSAVPSWTDLAAFAAVGGLSLAVSAWRTRRIPPLVAGDPYLADGLAYETST